MKQNDNLNALMSLLVAVIFIGLACWATTADYNHTVVGGMNEDTYDSVISELSQNGNDSPSEAEIVEWWEVHHK